MTVCLLHCGAQFVTTANNIQLQACQTHALYENLSRPVLTSGELGDDNQASKFTTSDEVRTTNIKPINKELTQYENERTPYMLRSLHFHNPVYEPYSAKKARTICQAVTVKCN